MSKVLIAWELGAGLGHLIAINSLGQRLENAGCDLIYAVQDPEKAKTILSSSATFISSPQFQKAHTRQPINYSDLLSIGAFQSVDVLFELAKKWLDIFNEHEPDLVIVEHAPVARMMVRSMGIKHVNLSPGFALPAAKQPMPNVKWWEKIEPQQLEQVDANVLEIMNTVLTKLRLKPLKSVADTFLRAQENFITTFEEIDPYKGQRVKPNYCGTMMQELEGVKPEWPSQGEKKIFVYLHNEYPQLKQILSQLSTLNHRFVIFINGLHPVIKEHFSTDNVWFSDKPLQMQTVVDECDICICNANLNTVNTVLLAGKPLMMLPQYLEHNVTCLRVEELGAGLWARPHELQTHPARVLERLCTEVGFTNAAETFAKKYATYDANKVLDKAAKRCLALIK